MSVNSHEIAIKNGHSLPRNCIQAISHPTKMARWQKVALITFLGVAAGGGAFGTAFKLDAGTIFSASISVVAALVVMVTTTILISKKKELSPEEKFLRLNASREEAGIYYEASLRTPLLEREEDDIKALNENKNRYIKLLRQQINQPSHLQKDVESLFRMDDGELIMIPARATLQQALDGLITN